MVKDMLTGLDVAAQELQKELHMYGVLADVTEKFGDNVRGNVGLSVGISRQEGKEKLICKLVYSPGHGWIDFKGVSDYVSEIIGPSYAGCQVKMGHKYIYGKDT